MLRILKCLVGGAIAVVLLALAVHVVSRAMGPTRAEREALALVQAPPPDGGRDGFAALWTLGYDIPAAEQGRVLAEDVRSLGALAPWDPSRRDGPAWRSAREDWPRLGEPRQGDPDWCAPREAGCIERIRAAPAAYAGLLAHHGRLLERTDALSAYDRFRSPLPPRLDAPFPEFQWLARAHTRDAWRFAQGDADAALAGACAGVAQGRTLIVGGDSLVGSMVGAALVQGNATLLAEMLAELPRGHPLPPACEAALGLPLDLEAGICRTMLSEGRWVSAGIQGQATAVALGASMGRDVPAWASGALFDPERTAARGAPKFAWYCSAQARELIAADRPLLDPAPPPSRWSLACASNPIGCVLADVAQPAYRDYGVRLQDADARLRTLAALLWLRRQDGVIDEAAVARLPAPMRSAVRPLRLDATAGTLGVDLYESPRPEPRGHDGTWSVPLPASRLQAAGASP
ncbi:hypothetical protein [Pseudoxanthomonas sp. 10H]|uniref:hypothetical protein n=1 Tax=Pseudoxanthomonas sp. 10H TaxID=3242729 RepID=UPI003555F8F1